MHLNPLLQSVQLALQSNTQKDALRLIDEIVEFCVKHENGKVLGEAEEDVIRLIVAYHWAKKTLYTKFNESGELEAVFMWYHCDEDDDWNFVTDWEPDKEDGDSIYLAFLYTSSTEAFRDGAKGFLEQCPQALNKKLFGIRRRRGIPRRVNYTQKLFKKILEL